MPERASKKKARRNFPASSVEEQEATSSGTENAQKIPDRDVSEFSEKVEKSVCRRIRETETNLWAILKMIKNLSSKIDSLSGRIRENLNIETSEFRSEIIASTSRNCETKSVTQDEGLYKNWFLFCWK